MSSESTTPLANLNHLGKRFSALLLIITFLQYSATPDSASLAVSNMPGLDSGT